MDAALRAEPARSAPAPEVQDALDECACRLDFIQEALCWAAYGQPLQLSDTAAAGLSAILTDIAQALRGACGE